MLPREAGGVVDSTLKVYGLSNLRVVDASIFPLVSLVRYLEVCLLSDSACSTSHRIQRQLCMGRKYGCYMSFVFFANLVFRYQDG